MFSTHSLHLRRASNAFRANKNRIWALISKTCNPMGIFVLVFLHKSSQCIKIYKNIQREPLTYFSHTPPLTLEYDCQEHHHNNQDLSHFNEFANYNFDGFDISLQCHVSNINIHQRVLPAENRTFSYKKWQNIRSKEATTSTHQYQ